MRLLRIFSKLGFFEPDRKTRPVNALENFLNDAVQPPEKNPESELWVPTHRHRKGGLYRVLGLGVLEADRTDAVIYRDVEGTVWIRPLAEFEDGRFERLSGK